MENSLCVFCQDEYDGNSLQMATGSGRQKVKDYMERRKALGDVKNKGVIERLEREIIKDSELRWHRKCYSDFTHREKIGRLETPASRILQDHLIFMKRYTLLEDNPLPSMRRGASIVSSLRKSTQRTN